MTTFCDGTCRSGEAKGNTLPICKGHGPKIGDYAKIPKFTPSGSYRINVGWDYLEEWLKRHMEDGLNLDPDFQRAHVWTEQQQVAYVEYSLRGGKSGRELFFNCKGWHAGERDFETFVIVDGKQRLKAVRRFLNNEIPAFGTLRKDFKGRMRMQDADFVVTMNDLNTRKEVLKWYLEMNTGGTPHTEEEILKVEVMYATCS